MRGALFLWFWIMAAGLVRGQQGVTDGQRGSPLPQQSGINGQRKAPLPQQGITDGPHGTPLSQQSVTDARREANPPQQGSTNARNTATLPQQGITNLAATRGLALTAAPAYRVDSSPVNYARFLALLESEPRRHLFTVTLRLRNDNDSILPLSLGYGELDYIDARLDAIDTQRGKPRQTPTAATRVPGDTPPCKPTAATRVPGGVLPRTTAAATHLPGDTPPRKPTDAIHLQGDTPPRKPAPAIAIQGGKLRRTPPGASYLQRQAGVLPLSLPPRSEALLTATIRQRTDEYSFDGLTLYDDIALDAAFARDLPAGNSFLILQMLFWGFLLCQLLFVLFQWLMIRRPEYGYYLLYMTLIAFYFLSRQEGLFGVDILFGRWPPLTVYLGKTLLILAYFVYFRFIRHFLEIPRDHPRLNRRIVWVEGLLITYALLDFLFIVITFDRPLQTLVYTVAFTLIFLLTLGFMVYMYRQRQPLIVYIISGSLFVATGHILGLIFSYLEINRHLDLGVPDIFIFPQAGIVLEVLCFTAGLSYKSQLTEKEKVSSQQKLIEQLKANELLQTRMQYIRNKIAQDLHDDIGSTLSSISILSDLALRENSGSQTLETMNEIKDSSIMLMERMDDIVWSINPRNDSLENLLMRVRHFATTLFEARGVDYVIDIQKNIGEVRLPMDYRQHIYLILKEAINNLVKYAGASQAWLEVRFDERHLVLCVRDNGRGFTLSGPFPGNGLCGMQRRAEIMDARLSIRSAPGEGTAIALQVDLQ